MWWWHKEDKSHVRDSPGGLVVKTPCSQCRRSRFDPWSGNHIPHGETKTLPSQINNLFFFFKSYQGKVRRNPWKSGEQRRHTFHCAIMALWWLKANSQGLADLWLQYPNCLQKPDQRPRSLLRSDGDEIGLSPGKNLETTREVREEDSVTMSIKFCSFEIFRMHILHKINQLVDIYWGFECKTKGCLLQSK